MGRFSLNSSPQDDDHDDNTCSQLTTLFIAPRADNDSLVPQEPYVNTPSIYIYHHQPSRDYKPRRISIWWMALGALVLAHVVARFGPPAPPPPPSDDFHDWHDFFREQGTRLYQSLTALASVLPHVWHWCIQNMRQELSHAYDEWTRLPPCPLVIVNHTTNWNIAGQARAVSVINDAIQAWTQQSPLVLFLSGTVGTGKLELARQIGQLVASTGDGTCTDGVLELDAFQQQQENDLLVHDIGMHAVRHGAHGAVVILRHVDAMSTRHFLQVLKSLQQHQKLMFVGITGIGTRSIHRHLKRYKHMRHIPKMQLDMDIRDELDEHLFSFANEPVETYLHAIAPFAPIGHAELQEILQLAIEKISRQEQGIRWKSLVITKELTEALVSPSNVEYLEWKDKTTGETVLVFSATGAHVLEEGSPIMNTITSQIQQCLTDVAPDRVGKLDFDKSIGQGVVSWCVGTSCFETCRFSISS